MTQCAATLSVHRAYSDDALWALDGLASGSAATARDSLATLAEICATKRGRLALRSGQLAADVLAAAGGLGDCVLRCAVVSFTRPMRRPAARRR